MRNYLRYELKDASGRVIFSGSDFGCSPMHGIDSDESLRALLGFLTLRIGDTDREYFDSYTPEQMDFANEHGETLSMYATDDDPQPFDDEVISDTDDYLRSVIMRPYVDQSVSFTLTTWQAN